MKKLVRFVPVLAVVGSFALGGCWPHSPVEPGDDDGGDPPRDSDGPDSGGPSAMGPAGPGFQVTFAEAALPEEGQSTATPPARLSG